MNRAIDNRNPGATVSRGMTLMAAAMLIAPAMDAIAKLLGAELPVLQIVWGRFFFQSVLLTPLVLALGGLATLRTRRPFAQFARGFLLGIATVLFFSALKYMPIANAIAIFFVEPLILTIISALFLGEHIGWRRVFAIVVGFIGALIVIRPSFVEVGWPALLPLAAALCFAIYLALTRSLADDVRPLTTQVHAGYAGCLTLTFIIGISMVLGVDQTTPIWPTERQWMLLLMLGGISAGAHLLIAMAFQLAGASILAPFQYLEIISATLLGLLIFGDFPEPLTWVGIAIIIGSGLFVYWRERKPCIRRA